MVITRHQSVVSYGMWQQHTFRDCSARLFVYTTYVPPQEAATWLQRRTQHCLVKVWCHDGHLMLDKIELLRRRGANIGHYAG